MATMTITQTHTGVQEPAITEQHPEAASTNATRQIRALENGITLAEHDANRFLDGVPRLDHLQMRTPRTLRQIVHSHITVRPGAGGGPTAPIISTVDEPVNILVLEFGEVIERQTTLRSVDALRKYLKENRYPKQRVYLVSQDSLTENVVGLLGSALELDADFFALQITMQDPPLGLRLPSTVADRQSSTFDYHRNVQGLPRERVSFSVSQKREDTWTGIFLLDDYELTDFTILSLGLGENGGNGRPTLFRVVADSIIASSYKETNPSSRLSAVLYMAFPVAISEWTNVISGLRTDAEIARQTLKELSEGNLSQETRKNKLEWLKNTALNQNIRHHSFYDSFLRLLNSMLETLNDCEMIRSRLEGEAQGDRGLIREDISFLISQGRQLQHENEVLLSKRSSILSTDGSDDTPEEHSEGRPLPDYRTYTGNTSVSPGFSGSSPPPRSDPPPGRSGSYLPFAEHIQTKIDQIAYMTNLLFSLSFIASVYGMNLDIFSNGGLVPLSHFLGTAIPFSFLVFVITFFMPAGLSKILGSKNGLRRRAQYKIEPV